MEELYLSETELRYFGDLFLCCDVEKTGKISTLKATELFRSANLTNDIVKQIMSLVSIPSTSIHLSRKQFYSCLKLIAAHQATIQLRQDLITSIISLPLPRFSWKDSPTPISTNTINTIITTNTTTGCGGGTTLLLNNSSTITNNLLNNEQQIITQQQGGGTTTINNGIQNIEQIEWRDVITPDITIEDTQIDTGNSDQPSTDSEVEQNDTHLDGTHRLRSPTEAWSTASDSPTPTNSVAERPWAKNTLWQGLLCEEQRQLLGTEEESSDRHSSDDDNDVDLETVYQITSEQKEYYTNQFRAVQPDLNGLLVGHVARIFFEKSRIPVEELRHIWQLCDVTRDGALSLGEFTAAMHLVVLRRNNIPLPSQLPPCLILTIGQTNNNLIQTINDPPEADLLNLDDDESTGSSGSPTTGGSGTSGIPKTVTTTVNRSESNSPITTSISTTTTLTGTGTITGTGTTGGTNERSSPTTIKNLEKDWTQQSKDWSASKQWTKFTESPTSNVSSPGPKPVNFDMQRTAQAVVSDPQILHPVPLRVTPVGPEPLDDESSRHYRKTENLVYDVSGVLIVSRENDTNSPNKQLINQHRDSIQNDIRPIQRPQPKKLPTIGALPPPPQREASIGSSTASDTSDVTVSNIANVINISKKEPPPLPPPRPHRHARSSSLDLNKLKLNAPPEIPPRVSPQTSVDLQMETGNPSFADFAKFPDSSIEFQVSDDVTDSQVGTIHLDSSGNIPPYPRPTIPSLQSSQRTSAFEIYRKPGSRNSQSPTEGGSSIIGITGSGGTVIGIGGTTSRTSEYEKRVSLISDNLRHVTFKQDKNMKDILKHLKEQNTLLLKLCNDLSDELLTVQQKKEEIRLRLDTNHQHNNYHFSGGGDSSILHHTNV